jgi:hypothetical protein
MFRKNTPRRRSRFLMEVVRLVEEKVLSMAVKVLGVLEGEFSFLNFESILKVELDGLGCEILKLVLEELDREIKADANRKKQWEVVRKGDAKGLLTPFGMVNYKRTYYRHKESRKYSYLVDRKAGIEPNSRVSENVKAELVDASAVMSYENATVELSRYNRELKVSKQTVGSYMKGFVVKEEPAPEEKKKVKVIYIEADEDYIKVRGKKKKTMAKLVYIHEGVTGKKRKRLINSSYFTTVNKSSDELWYEIAEYIDMYYDLDSVEQIFLSADGASWIKVGLDYIYDATFILDKFHLNKCIKAATEHAKELKWPVYRGIYSLNQEKVLNNLRKAHQQAEGDARQKRIIDAARYIRNNWAGIEAQVKYPEVGCSAEGHVSHVLSARMSSRPMAWSSVGAESMTQMRAVRANGGSVKEHYLAHKEEAPVIVELKQAVKKELRRLQNKKPIGKEDLHNIPLFNGPDNLTRKALRGLSNRLAV